MKETALMCCDIVFDRKIVFQIIMNIVLDSLCDVPTVPLWSLSRTSFCSILLTIRKSNMYSNMYFSDIYMEVSSEDWYLQ